MGEAASLCSVGTLCVLPESLGEPWPQRVSPQCLPPIHDLVTDVCSVPDPLRIPLPGIPVTHLLAHIHLWEPKLSATQHQEVAEKECGSVSSALPILYQAPCEAERTQCPWRGRSRPL